MRKAFNTDWRFRENDGGWREVTLPHDAMIHTKRTADAPGGSNVGFYAGGRYTYEKTFPLTAQEAEQRITFEFEGVYKHAQVYINGHKIGGCAYGYVPFEVSADGFVHEGENVIRVEAENADQPDSRFYSGAGIYRPVWMRMQDPEAYIALHGIKIDTKQTGGDGKPAVVEVRVRHHGGTVTTRILRADGTAVAEKAGDAETFEIPDAKLWSAETPYLYTAEVTLRKTVKSPAAASAPANEDSGKDDSAGAGNGMTDDLTSGDGGDEKTEIAEIQQVRFGIRLLSWSPEGFFINGKNTYLRGGCIHADNGILGTAEYDESAMRRIRILKECGFNAIRSAHNPCSEAVLRACDELGMYVMDETWDMWYMRKTSYDYALDFEKTDESDGRGETEKLRGEPNWRKDLRAMIDKDYDHPSVIIYSIGNEVSEPAEKKGVKLARKLTDLCHELDPSRPVGGGFNLMIIANAAKGKALYKDGQKDDSGDKKMEGMNSALFNLITSFVGTGMNKAANGRRADEAVSPLLDTIDVGGYNYASGRYPKEGKLHPGRVIFGSETFPQTLAENWKMVHRYPYLFGDFMWTAWDYVGETGIGAWSWSADAKAFAKPYPWMLADAGAFDILGHPTGEALWAKAVWDEDISDDHKHGMPYLAVQPCDHPWEKLIRAVWRGTNAIPSWSWRGCEGNKAVVEVYSSAPAVALRLNGRRIGRKRTKNCMAVFHVKWQPGVLTAVSIDETGHEIGRTSLRSADRDVHIAARAEDAGKNVKPGQIIYIDLRLQDKRGIVESCADEELQISVSGGEMLAFGSAQPRTEERFDTGIHRTWYGRAQAVVRAGDSGDIVLHVTEKRPGGDLVSEHRIAGIYQ